MPEIPAELNTIAALLTILTAGLGVWKYIDYRSKTDKIRAIGRSFEQVVGYLSSDVEAERLAGAILLRRFFDESSEFGQAGTPYAQEAINVIAACLRGEKPGNFQKLLADGLAYAPSLDGADLQKANLQNAYLGSRKLPSPYPSRARRLLRFVSPGGESEVTEPVRLRKTDFYRADLSGASLKGADAPGAIFYQARLHGTVLSEACLENANFQGADLRDARFAGSTLEGALFRDARNVPEAIQAKLNEEGTYSTRPSGEPGDALPETRPTIEVFMSKPGTLSYRQRQVMLLIMDLLESEGFSPATLERSDYPEFGVVSEVSRIMSECAGAVILGFSQLEVRDGTWRPGTSEQRQVEGEHRSTPWNHIEAGMAAMHGLPLLIVRQEPVSEGIFDIATGEHRAYEIAFGDGEPEIPKEVLANWSCDVRERSSKV